MSNPEELREVTDRVLNGLTADESLKYRILQKAASKTEDRRNRFFNPAAALCSVVAVLVFLLIAMNGLQPVSPSLPGEMNVFAAGSTDTAVSAPPYTTESLFPAGFKPESLVSIELSGIGTIDDPSQCAMLARILIDNSVRSDAEITSADGMITFVTADGSAFCFHTAEPYLADKGCWSCPEFFSSVHTILSRK